MDQISIDPKRNLKVFTYYPEEESNFPPVIPPQENRLIPIPEDDLRNIGIIFHKLEIEEEFTRKGSTSKKTVLYSQQIMEKLQRDLEKDRQDIEQQENTQKQNALLRKQEKKEKKKEKQEAVIKQQEIVSQKKENNLLERYQSQASSSALNLFLNQYDYYTRQLADEAILKEIAKLQEQKQIEQEQEKEKEQEQPKKVSIPKINLESVMKSPEQSPKKDAESSQNQLSNLRVLNKNIFKALASLPPGIMKPPIVPVTSNDNKAQHDDSDALESSHSFNELFSSRENTSRLQKK